MKYNVKVMTKDELFKEKGELSWTIDLAQAKLKAVNEELIARENIPETANISKPIYSPNSKNGTQLD